jgi:hypothetical protein
MTAHHGTLRARATRRNGGQGMALLAVFLIVLIGLVGLGVDGGSLYLNRRQVQNAADAAALAGAFTMARGDKSGADIRAAIDKYADANYIDDSATNVSAHYVDINKANIGTVDPAGTAPAAAVGVEVIATKQAVTFFMPILGFNNLKVQTIAAAHGTPPAPGGPGYGMFAIESGKPLGTKVIDWSSGSWTVSGTIHTNSDIVMSGTSNVINGTVEDVSGASPAGLTGKATLTPSSNNPVQSTVLPDPVNQTFAHYCPSTTSTATYHYLTGNQNLASFVTNGAMETGIYCVNGNINFAAGVTTLSDVTFVASGTMQITASDINFEPYAADKMLFFSDITSNNTGLNISAAAGSWKGIAYAPHSTLQYSGGQNVVSKGSLVGWTIKMTNGNGTLTYDPTYFGAPSLAQIFLYE